jgi:MFS family permease
VRRPGAFNLLRERNAGLYLGGILVSGFGSSAMWLAAGVWVKSLTGSSSLAALSTFCLWAPTLAGPAIGTAADRVRRRPLLIWTSLGTATTLLVLFAVNAADRIWILFAVLLVYGTSSVLLDAAEAGLVAAAVPGDLLGDFNGLRMSANEGMKLLAPLAGAGLFAAFGGPSVAVLDAVTFAVAAGLFGLLRVREPAPGAAAGVGGWGRQTADGFRFLWHQPLLRRLVLAGAATMFLAGLNGAAIYAVVDAGLHRSPAFVGVLYAVQGAGSVIGGLIAGPLMRRLPERSFAAAGILCFAAGVAVRAVPSAPVAFACSAAIGVGLPSVLIGALTAVQRETPGPLLGRVAATANTLIFVPNALALATGAGLIAVADHRAVLIGAGVAGVLTALYCASGITAHGR